MTFEAEVNSYLESINALLRNQYSMGYYIDQPHTPGKKYKIEVKVDVDGDGVYDDKQYARPKPHLLHRPRHSRKKK